MKKNFHVLICGNYGATNIGDEAILQSIFQFVRSTFHDCRLQVVSANPGLTSKQYEVESVPQIPAGIRSLWNAFFSKRLRQTLNAYKQADVVVFGGGGLFSDEKPRAIFIWLMQILPAFWYKKPVMCLGQSIGPLFMRSSRWVVRKIFENMKIITVRDEASRQTLHKMGIDHARVLPDPVFGLHTRKIDPSPLKAERRPYIVFSLRPWIKNAEKIHGILAEFVDWVYETYHLRTYFVPFQSNQDNDEKELMELFSRLHHRDAAQVFAHNENICDVLHLMERSTAVVGMRLHSLIFAAVTHTPFLGLSYSLKVAEVVRQLGMENYFCEYRFIELDVLKKKFEALFAHRAHLEKALVQMHAVFEKQTDEYSALLREIVS